MTVVIICGGRNFTPPAASEELLIGLINGLEVDRVFHGGARGVDQWAGDVISRRTAVSIVVFRPQYEHENDRAAPLRRNRKMADIAISQAHGPGNVYCLAFDGGRGTYHMVETAKKAGILVVDLSLRSGA